MTYDNAVSYVHMLLRQHLGPGDVAVDATAGNGLDAACMAECIGAEGVLYCFDVQPVALEVTSARLQGIPVQGYAVLAGHERMREHVPAELHGRVRAVTFNLGYLPGGDKALTTMADTTRVALEAARDILADDGIITIVCYRHQEGERELMVLRSVLPSWSQDRYTVTETSFINQRGTPPIVFVVSSRAADAERSHHHERFEAP